MYHWNFFDQASNMTCNQSSSDWFEYEAYENFLAENCTWPWINIDVDQWVAAISPLRLKSSMSNLDQLFVLAIVPLGILGSFFCICVLWRKAFKKRKRFYVWMILIAFLDLLFCTLYIPDAISWGELFESTYKYNYIGTEACCILEGVIYGASLASDLCALALTIERFLAICRPTMTSGFNRKLFLIVSITMIICFSFLRFMRYAFDSHAVENGPDDKGVMTYSWENTQISRQSWFISLVFLTDILLPFILLICMSYLSLRIAISVVGRQHSHAFDSASPQQILQLQRDSAAMLKLMFILIFLFVFTQLVYCLYAISIIVKRRIDITFDSTAAEIRAFANADIFYNAANLLSYIVETLARSVNFYFYLCFSKSIRKQVKKFLDFRQDIVHDFNLKEFSSVRKSLRH